jgi:urease subunit gamma/beta
VHLTPREQERLLLATAADLARRRLLRGARLGATEAVALLCDEVCEWAWDGIPVDEVVTRARTVVDAAQLQPGVSDLVPSVQVEALFPHGSVLVHVDQPFGPPTEDGPGAVRPAAPPVELAPAHDRRPVQLTNTGHQAVWVSSHFPMEELNRAVVCDPVLPAGYRLDIAAGEAVSLPPGESRLLTAVSFRRSGEGDEAGGRS